MIETFESKYIPEPNSGCFLWLGNIFKKRGGYGAFTHGPSGVIMQRAHRVSWEIYRGPLTKEQHVLHSCDNPLCVNPDHLFLGNQDINMKDKVAKGRQNKGETHGKAKLTEEQVLMIRAHQGSQRELAKSLGISQQTISDIKTRRSWKYL